MAMMAAAVATAMGKPIAEALKELKKPERRVYSHHYAFLAGSSHPNLRSTTTKINVGEAQSMAPDPNDKNECTQFAIALQDKVRALGDDLNTHAFVKKRTQLVVHLYALTCLRDTRERGDDYAYGSFLRAVAAIKQQGASFRLLTRVTDGLHPAGLGRAVVRW